MPVCPSCGQVSARDAQFCSRCGHALTAETVAERRALVTIVFCDLVGSTALGERLDPEVLRSVQSRYFAVGSTALQRHGGQVEKFIGDALMCVFGLPRAHEDDALRGCRAAQDLLSAVSELNGNLERELGIRLALRIGVNTGEVVAGDVSRGQALVTGDAVNTAARLEQAAGTDEVLIGELTHRLVADAVEAEPAPSVAAKGKAELVPAFRLISAHTRRHERLQRNALVGRNQELNALRSEFEAVAEQRHAALVIVDGEPGIGKSRLTAELVGGLPPEVRVLRGQCPSYGEGITYWPLREWLDALAGDDPGRLIDELEGGPRPRELADRLLRLIGRVDGPVEADQAFGAVARMLSTLAARKPVVAVIEDLHWAEPTLLELLGYLVEALRESPVLLVATRRPDPDGDTGELPARVLRLEALQGPAAAQLLEARGGVPSAQLESLIRAAGGNPLFLEQLQAAASEGTSGLPPDLQALLGARIDALDAGERRVLEVAAVVGREFWPAALSALLPTADAGELPGRLAALRRRELIEIGAADARGNAPAGLSGVFGVTERLSFRHALIQDAAYAALPKRRASELHERFAGFLERRRGRDLEIEPVLAWHLERAAQLRDALRPRSRPPVAARAAAALEAAGRRALSRADPLAAANLLSRAAALLPSDAPERVNVERALEHTRVETARPAGASAEIVPPGDSIAGYVVEGVAGQGGMGIVYRARDRALRRPVALKVIAPGLARDVGFRARFQRESRIAAQLEHPNVIPVYRAGEDAGRLFIAMRFVEGSDLATLLAERAPLPPTEAAQLIADIAEALDAAHARGLVHRDVKPANVLLSGSGGDRRVYLTDFGLSVEGSAQGGLTGTGQWVGTVAYIAPEQIRGAAIDARCDIYALGGVLHHCITGELPFPREHELDALAAHLGDAPPRPSRLVSGLPVDFDAVVARALAKHPDDRYQTAGDLARAVHAVSRGERLPRAQREPAVSRPLHAARAASRLRPRKSWFAAAVLGLTALVAGASALQSGRGEGSTPGADNPAGRLVGAPIKAKEPPVRLALLGDDVWTMNVGGGGLTRIDPSTGRTKSFLNALDLGGGIFPDLTAGFGSLWVAHEARVVGGVDRVDPADATPIEHVLLPGARVIATGRDKIWAAGVERRKAVLHAIDPRTNRLTGGPVEVGRDPSDVAAEPDAVWVADRARDRLTRVDPTTTEIVARVTVGDRPGVIAVAPDTVWIANLGDRTLSRVDPGSNRVLGAPLSLGKEIQDIAFSVGSLWVASADATVTRLDATSGRTIGSPIDVGDQKLALIASPDGVWVAGISNRIVRRIRAG